MAKFYPTFDNINRLKVQPTEGEKQLLMHLSKILSDEYEVYFQPFFNSFRPDIVIMRRGYGVIIIEVKDWNLKHYAMDAKGQWTLANGTKIPSPFKQVYQYQQSMLWLHIPGLAEAVVKNKNHNKIVVPYVYFHGASKVDIDRIFEPYENAIKQEQNNLNDKLKKQHIDQKEYDREMDALKYKKIGRGTVVRNENLSEKLRNSFVKSPLFTDEIYEEFKRYLQPPFHTKNQGIEKVYSNKQTRLVRSEPGFLKIKGVAGSGKTTVLAKRAVNAHKRHKDKVLILTFNLTLKNCIHDMVSDVREDFSWSAFQFTNYHYFIREQRNCSEVPDPLPARSQEYFDKFYDDEAMFDGYKAYKYKTILIDEIQDFKPEWIKIIRKYFLEDEGEMLLFGDEGQNIYEREISKTNTAIVQGFGRWERLTKSYRSKGGSPLTHMIKEYQNSYLVSKYDIDNTETDTGFLSLDLDIIENVSLSDSTSPQTIAQYVADFMKKYKIQPNDLCVVAATTNLLRKVEHEYIKLTNELTNTTFETEEIYCLVKEETKDKDNDQTNESLEKIRRSKKNHYWQNLGTLKLSTVHSFKGLEAENIVYIMDNKDSAEIVYTAITRPMRHLLVFTPKNSEYNTFFEKHVTKGLF